MTQQTCNKLPTLEEIKVKFVLLGYPLESMAVTKDTIFWARPFGKQFHAVFIRRHTFLAYHNYGYTEYSLTRLFRWLEDPK